MKKLGLFVALVALLTACKDKTYQKYWAYVPVYTDYETFRSAENVAFEGPKLIEAKGNIYFKDDYLFMVEPEKGIHFIDNSNPSAPKQVGFLNVVGATGMSIKGNYLYANSFIDLVVFDIANITAPTQITRLTDVFPGALPEVDNQTFPFSQIDKANGVVTDWEVKKVKEEIQYHTSPTWIDCPNCETFGVAEANFDASISSTPSVATGIAGSISLFTIVNNYLYVMENGNMLNPFDITNPAAPIARQDVGVWRNVETLFPYQDYIFMGTPSGMLIYGTNVPSVPDFISDIDHVRGCDPVVVQDNYAYVTVRSGGFCGGSANQLDVIDISSISNPQLKESFQMSDPHGLGIDGDNLFICDGSAGLKLFDASNPENSGNVLLHQFGHIQATDIIPLNGVAMVIGDGGIHQYDYSDPSNLKHLSTISF